MNFRKGWLADTRVQLRTRCFDFLDGWRAAVILKEEDRLVHCAVLEFEVVAHDEPVGDIIREFEMKAPVGYCRQKSLGVFTSHDGRWSIRHDDVADTV